MSIPQQDLHSDSSNLAWGGGHTLNKVCPRFLEGAFHTTYKHQRISCWYSNRQEPGKATVSCPTFSGQHHSLLLSQKSWRKFPQYNQILRPFLSWLMQNQVDLSLEWVPSQDQQADSLSRWGVDPGDYTLHPWVFQWVKHHFQPWATP